VWSVKLVSARKLCKYSQRRNSKYKLKLVVIIVSILFSIVQHSFSFVGVVCGILQSFREPRLSRRRGGTVADGCASDRVLAVDSHD